jgi:hypothetical protein
MKRNTKYNNKLENEQLSEMNKAFWRVEGKAISMKKNPP